MNDEQPKIDRWHYDQENVQSSPEMQRPQPVSWSAVGDNMASDARQRHAIKWYFNVPYIFLVFILSRFISPLIGISMIVIALVAIVRSLLAGPKSPYRTWEIVGWTLLYGVLTMLIILL